MQLTTQMVERFKGGQMEIQNQNEGYLYRGEVKTIAVENDTLQVKFSWVAKGEGGPPLPEKWVKDDNLDYAASLEIYSVSNIGPSGEEVGGGDRLCLNSFIVGELAVLYPTRPTVANSTPAKSRDSSSCRRSNVLGATYGRTPRSWGSAFSFV